MNSISIKDLVRPVNKPERLSDVVLDQLKHLLLKRNLKPGDKLPTEKELSELFGVGRPSIREAIRSLCMLGFLEIRRGDGIYVRKSNLHAYFNGIQESLEIMVRMEPDILHELFELRKLLEPYAASQAAKNANDDDIAALRTAYQDLEMNISDSGSYVEMDDFGFHKAVAHCSHNALLYHMINLMHALIRRLEYQKYAPPDMGAKFHTDHRMIFKSIVNHSPKDAASAMRRHIRHGETLFRNFLKQKDPM